MAGTLVISTLSDGTNSTSSTNCIQGSAKAWVQLNGASGAIRASYNVSSVTRNSTGYYTVTFTNALADSNYAVSMAAGPVGGSALMYWFARPATASVAYVYTWQAGVGNADYAYTSIACFR